MSVETKYHFDPMENRLYIKRVQDVEPILEANKRQFNDAKENWKGDFHHVARIPEVVIEKWCNENGCTYAELMKDNRLLKRFLNDPDNKLFRTKGGRI